MRTDLVNDSGLPDGLAALYGVLFRPQGTFDAWGDEAPLGAAFFLLAALSVVLALALAPSGIGALVLTWAVLVGWLTFVWLLLSSLAYVVGSLLGGRGALPGVMGAVAFAFSPLMLLAPVGAWWWSGGPAVAVGVATLAVLLWWGHVLHAAVRGSMGLTSTQATLAILGAELAAVGIPAAYVLLLVLTLTLSLL